MSLPGDAAPVGDDCSTHLPARGTRQQLQPQTPGEVATPPLEK